MFVLADPEESLGPRDSLCPYPDLIVMKKLKAVFLPCLAVTIAMSFSSCDLFGEDGWNLEVKNSTPIEVSVFIQKNNDEFATFLGFIRPGETEKYSEYGKKKLKFKTLYYLKAENQSLIDTGGAKEIVDDWHFTNEDKAELNWTIECQPTRPTFRC